MENLLSWLGELAANVGITALLIGGGIKLWGEKWLKVKFDKELEEHKSKLGKQLEEHKSELQKQRMEHQQRIDWQTDQINKIREKEYELLPELWERLQETIQAFRQYIGALRPPKGLEGMTDLGVEECCKASGFSPSQIERVKKQKGNREEVFDSILFDVRNGIGANKWQEAKTYYEKKSLFLEEGLKGLFGDVLQKMKEAHVAYCLGRQSKDKQSRKEGIAIFEKEVPELVAKIETTIQSRLNQKLELSPPPSPTPEQEATP